EWRAVLPVVDCGDEAAMRLRLPRELEQLNEEHWTEALRATESISDDIVIGRVYAAACTRMDAPERIRCRVGETHVLESPTHVSVVHDERELAALRSEKVPVVLVVTATAAETLEERWGMSGEQMVATNVAYG